MSSEWPLIQIFAYSVTFGWLMVRNVRFWNGLGWCFVSSKTAAKAGGKKAYGAHCAPYRVDPRRKGHPTAT